MRQIELKDLLLPALILCLFGTDWLYLSLEILFRTLTEHTQALWAHQIYSLLFRGYLSAQIVWAITMLGFAGLMAWLFHVTGHLEHMARPGRLDPAILAIIALFVAGDHAISVVLIGLSSWLTGQDTPWLYQPGQEYILTMELLPADILLGWFAAPISEEFLFRGVLFSILLARGWRPMLTVFVCAALFALTHAQYQLLGLLIVFISGVLFGLLRLRSGGLLAPILCHALLNASITLMDVYELVSEGDLSRSL